MRSRLATRSRTMAEWKLVLAGVRRRLGRYRRMVARSVGGTAGRPPASHLMTAAGFAGLVAQVRSHEDCLVTLAARVDLVERLLGIASETTMSTGASPIES